MIVCSNEKVFGPCSRELCKLRFGVMSTWERLAEARIKEWMARPDSEKTPSTEPAGAVVPLEVQLLQEIVQLYKTVATAREQSEIDAARKRALMLEARLFILLEVSGRPLAVRHFEHILQEIRNQKNE